MKKCVIVESAIRKAGDLREAYSYYLIIGGMPEYVSSWIKYKDPDKVSQIQRELIEIYENDFSKHNGKVNSGRISSFLSLIQGCSNIWQVLIIVQSC